MPWVPVHQSGLSYTFHPGGGGSNAWMVDSTVTLERRYPSTGTVDGLPVHWHIEFDEGQGDVQFRITVQAPPHPELNESEYALHSTSVSTVDQVLFQGSGEYEGVAVPYGEFLTPVVGFYAGDGEKGDESQYLVEVWQDGTDPGGLSLIKDFERVLVSPYVPPRAAVQPLAFWMYATPLPIGWRYEPYYVGGQQRPRDLASFNLWATQIMAAPPEYAPGAVTWTYVAVEDLVSSGYSTGLPSGSEPVYGYDGNGDYVLKGYRIPEAGAAQPLPSRYWGPLPYMTFVTFPDVPTDGPYGYPVGQGPFEGYFDVPTVDGVQRFRSIYHKDHRGVLLRAATPALPPYCTQRGPARVVAIADFPGCDAVPAIPAQFSFNGRPGWNAGANSAFAHDGDCELTFTPSIGVAGAIGLARTPREPTRLDNLTHAFYFVRQANGRAQWAVMERGRRMSAYTDMSSGDIFKIARLQGSVTYWVSGSRVYESLLGSEGRVCAGAALYHGGDGVY